MSGPKYLLKAVQCPDLPDGVVEDLMRVLGEVADRRHMARITWVNEGIKGEPFIDGDHPAWEWVSRLRHWVACLTNQNDTPVEGYRNRLVKVAAIAVAATQSHDRVTGSSKRRGQLMRTIPMEWREGIVGLSEQGETERGQHGQKRYAQGNPREAGGVADIPARDQHHDDDEAAENIGQRPGDEHTAHSAGTHGQAVVRNQTGKLIEAAPHLDDSTLVNFCCHLISLFSLNVKLVFGALLAYGFIVATQMSVLWLDEKVKRLLRRSWRGDFLHSAFLDWNPIISVVVKNRFVLMLVGVALALTHRQAPPPHTVDGMLLLGLVVGMACGWMDVGRWLRRKDARAARKGQKS